MEILPASQADEQIYNQSSNHSEEPVENNPTSRHEEPKGNDDVDSSLQEYQPLLPSELVQNKAKRKASTFVVTPVSIIENNVQDIQSQQVNLAWI